MARPRKQTVDYFPHFCTHGKTMYILEQNYGNDGYAFWFKLLEMLGSTDGHYLELENPADLEFLAAKTCIDKDKCREILDLLARLEAIDKELWEEGNVVWSDNFKENVKDAYRNRAIEIPSRPSFLHQKPRPGEVYSETLQEKPTKEIREDETKEKKIKESPNPDGFTDNSQPDKHGEVKFEKDHPAYKAAFYLAERIKTNNPRQPVPDQSPANRKMQKWAEEMDRLHRLGPPGGKDGNGYTWKEIKTLIDFAHDDEFWQGNILSPNKLRKQATKLENQMQRDQKAGGKNFDKGEYLNELMQEVTEEGGGENDSGGSF